MSNVTDLPTQVETSDEHLTHLEALKARLTGKKIGAEVEHGVLAVYTMGADGGPRPRFVIACERRPADGDRWWFRSGGHWIDQATHATDAALWVLGRLAGNRL